MTTREHPVVELLDLEIHNGIEWVRWTDPLRAVHIKRGGKRKGLTQSVDVGTLSCEFVNAGDPLVNENIVPEEIAFYDGFATGSDGWTGGTWDDSDGVTTLNTTDTPPADWVETRRNLSNRPTPVADGDWYGSSVLDGAVTRRTGVPSVRNPEPYAGVNIIPMGAWSVPTDGRPVSEGLAYSVSAYLRPSLAGCRASFTFIWITSAGGVISQSPGAVVAGLAPEEWTRVGDTQVAPSGAAYLIPAITFESTGTPRPSGYFWATDALIEQSDTVGEFFPPDLSTPTERAVWAGTPNDSALILETLQTAPPDGSATKTFSGLTPGRTYTIRAFRSGAASRVEVDQVSTYGETVTQFASYGDAQAAAAGLSYDGFEKSIANKALGSPVMEGEAFALLELKFTAVWSEHKVTLATEEEGSTRWDRVQIVRDSYAVPTPELKPNQRVRVVSGAHTVWAGTTEDIASTYTLDKNTGRSTAVVSLAAVDAVSPVASVTRYGAVVEGGAGSETWPSRINRLAQSAPASVEVEHVEEATDILRYSLG